MFISYQWDLQEEIIALRARLEAVGYECWMDIHKMGGGDRLDATIEAGMKDSKVVLACVTAKYAQSVYCR